MRFILFTMAMLLTGAALAQDTSAPIPQGNQATTPGGPHPKAWQERKAPQWYACADQGSALIGLTLAQLYAKCGQEMRSNVDTSARGESLQLIYAHDSEDRAHLIVYVDGGIVSHIQVR